MTKLNSRSIKNSNLYIVVAICSLFAGLPSKVSAETPVIPSNPTLLAQDSNSQLSEIQAYTISKYTYCDAALLADLWGGSVYEAKARIGRKVLWQEGGIPYLEQYLVDARSEALGQETSPCKYNEFGYTYDDAAALAEFWGDRSVWDAKMRIERNLVLGNKDEVDSALRMAKGQFQ